MFSVYCLVNILKEGGYSLDNVWFRYHDKKYKVGDYVVSSANGITWHGKISWILGPFITVTKTNQPESDRSYKPLPGT